MEKIPRPEYPRPDFVRKAWMNLNGDWEFDFDDNDFGIGENWLKKEEFSLKITVPFPFQSKLSGICDTNFHNIVWYARNFNVPKNWLKKHKLVLLHFGAVDYESMLWINGREVGHNKGGHVPFSFDITQYINRGNNRLVLRVVDTQDKEQPRGKQYFQLKSRGCFYGRTTGIWQTVWLEPVSVSHIENIKFTPDIDKGIIRINTDITEGNPRQKLNIEIRYKRKLIIDKPLVVNTGFVDYDLFINGLHLWTPETPNLYDVKFTLIENNKIIDEVDSYFGMRKVSVDKNQVLLNNKPYFQRLVLDQGYFPDGMLTAPSDKALKNDIIFSKKFGFNGCRKHQKVEDPRFLYWADRLGFLVWGEMANAFTWGEKTEEMFIQEWERAVRRDYNHPCVIVWTPFNESWGIQGVYDNPRIQSYVKRVVELTRQLDRTRLVNDNDGWEHTVSDIATVHDYSRTSKDFFTRYKKFIKNGKVLAKNHKEPFVKGKTYQGHPVLFTEYGGIGYNTKDVLKKDEWGMWGYGNIDTKEKKFLFRLKDVTNALYKMKFVCGFCYTQLTDVEQEINGFLTYNRKPKVKFDLIKKIIKGPFL